MIREYSKYKPFRFWCQKVLPLVYDDSLSYYELLNKVVDYLNNVIKDVNALGTAFEELNTMVTDYFENLDVQEEIDNKLDSMVEDGTLDAMIQPLVGDAVSEWLEDNVTPTGSAVLVDSTLTISGAAADAKITGDELNNLKNDLDKSTTNEEIWATGYWGVSDGIYVSSNNWIRSNQTIPNDVVFINSASKTYKIILLAYDDTTYIGAWFGHGFVKNYDYSYVRTSINLEEFRSKYPTYTFRVSITKIQGGSIVLNDAVSDLILQMSYTKKHEMDIKTITGDIAYASLWENGSLTASGDKVVVDSIFYQRLTTISFLRFVVPVTVFPKDGYVFSVTTYDMNGRKEAQFSAWQSVPFTFNRSDKLYRISIKSTSNETLGAESISDYIDASTWTQSPFDRIVAEFANVKAVNHRGYNRIAPENTLPAFEMSADFGFKYVETDVLFTADGVPVLMHDATINRTCCNAGDGSAINEPTPIASLNYSDLANYDACTPNKWNEWKGTKIPTFAEFVYCCKAHNLHMWIELKNEKVYTQEEIQRIISIVKQNGMEEHVTFISFSYDALALVKEEWDSVELGLNGTIENALALRTGKNRVFMIYNQTSASYSDAISNGFQVCFYTVNAVSELLALPTNAYDSILTNALFPSQVCSAVRFKFENS